MENLLSRHRNLSVLAAVLVAQVLGLAMQIRSTNPEQTRLIRVWAVSAVTPIERLIVHSQGGLYGIWHNYLYLRGVRQENRDLKAEIERLRLEQVRLNEDASQARRLQALLGFREKYTIQTLPAQVIGSGGSEQSRVVYLDKGGKDGLKPQMAVITSSGVVGKILQVYSSTAQVLLINDQSSGLGAILESSHASGSDASTAQSPNLQAPNSQVPNSQIPTPQQGRVHGIVSGSPAGETMLEKVLLGEDVQPGDRVLTSGGDGIFPKGLPVGTVIKVSQADSFLKIRLHPSADLSRLEEVLVIMKLEDVAPPATDVAGSQRAVDVLAARLPGVPVKTDPSQETPEGQKKPETTETPAPDSVPAPAVPQNAASKPQNSAPLPVPEVQHGKTLKPGIFKPAAVVANPAGNGPQ